jgi:hypothetical protein
MRFWPSAFLGAAFAVLLTVATAVAQTNPVIEHYRAYTAALDRGDLATATTEAQAALTASEARDGDGGRTAVLALNLATVHLWAGRPEQARPAAQRALDLARAGAQGVDPFMAEIILARSVLAIDASADAAAQLNALLTNPAIAALPAADIYSAAQQLGIWGSFTRTTILRKAPGRSPGLTRRGPTSVKRTGWRARTQMKGSRS